MFRGGEGGISQGGGKGVAREWDQTKRVSKGRERQRAGVMQAAHSSGKVCR